MAHFAQLDNNNMVTQVIVVNNSDILDGNGQESEAIGKEFCLQFGAGPWVQTSYSNSFRKFFAGVGGSYDPVKDEFVQPPQPPNHSKSGSI
jgi:hypothetical protein